jgi:small subunit ribosomal protein S8
MWSDPIADLLTQLRNGIRNRSKQVTLPYSRVKMNICQVFKDEGYLSDVEKIPGAAGRNSLRVTMKYGPRGEQV